MQPKVGLIYLTFATPDWERDIPRCLASLEKMTYPKDRVELICIESKSDRGTVKEWFEKTWMLKSARELPRITYLFSDQVIGFAGNGNRGFAEAKALGCDYIFLLNQDTEVDPNFLSRAVARAEQDPRIAYVQSFLLLGQDKKGVNSVGNAYHYLGFGYAKGYLWSRDEAERYFRAERRTNPDVEIGYASGAALLGRVSALEQCGLFDERFFLYHEDLDAALQARMRGWKIVIEPSSIVYHYYDFGRSIKKYYWMERNRWAVLFSSFHPRTLFLILPMLFLMEVGSFFFALNGGWWRDKLRVYRELLSRDFWRWMRVRMTRLQKARTISDQAFLSYAVSIIEFQGKEVSHPLLTQIANPLMRFYWKLVRRWI